MELWHGEIISYKNLEKLGTRIKTTCTSSTCPNSCRISSNSFDFISCDFVSWRVHYSRTLWIFRSGLFWFWIPYRLRFRWVPLLLIWCMCSFHLLYYITSSDYIPLSMLSRMYTPHMLCRLYTRCMTWHMNRRLVDLGNCCKSKPCIIF